MHGIIGLLSLFAGLWIVAVGLDVVHLDPARFKAPHWVPDAAGVSFSFVGLAIGLPEHFEALRNYFAGVMITALGSVFNWVALRQESGNFREV
jgi:uncharacterized membrane protein YeiH